VGAILLIFPGFITDFLGAALFLPAARRWIAAKFATLARGSRHTPRDAHVMELEPGEWHQIPDPRRRRRRKPKRGACYPCPTGAPVLATPPTAAIVGSER